MSKLTVPLVSVILPCFNAERFLPETLESVFRQGWPRLEVIAVDDGSTDGTQAKIRSYGDKVRLLVGPKTRGASAARNLGTREAQGDYLQYLDADDLLRPDAILRKAKALIDSGGDVAYSDWQKLEESKEGKFVAGPIVARRLEDVHPEPPLALLTDFWCPPAALLYRRSLVERIGGWNESMPVIEDARFVLEAALREGKFVHVPGVGADYRVQRKGTSLSQRDRGAFIRGVLTNASWAESWWTTNGGLTQTQRSVLAKVYRSCASNSFWLDEKSFEEAMTCLEKVEPERRWSGPKLAAKAARWIGTSLARLVLRPLQGRL